MRRENQNWPKQSSKYAFMIFSLCDLFSQECTVNLICENVPAALTNYKDSDR
jgi:hypothetical protein